MTPAVPWSYDVREAVDLYPPRQAVREVCASLGFTRTDGHELAIVVSELTSNILKYGIRGNVRFERCEDPRHGKGILIAASDIGPPFRNLDLAMRDGYDDAGPIDPGVLLKRGGLGAGLGAVVRLTDSFQLCAQVPQGKEIRVIRHLKRPRRG